MWKKLTWSHGTTWPRRDGVACGKENNTHHSEHSILTEKRTVVMFFFFCLFFFPAQTGMFSKFVGRWMQENLVSMQKIWYWAKIQQDRDPKLTPSAANNWFQSRHVFQVLTKLHFDTFCGKTWYFIFIQTQSDRIWEILQRIFKNVIKMCKAGKYQLQKTCNFAV